MVQDIRHELRGISVALWDSDVSRGYSNLLNPV
jgi:hypothetical protein